MNVAASIKKRCRKCRLVRRSKTSKDGGKKRVIVRICDNPNHKGRQG